jgi:hypothetical protein
MASETSECRAAMSVAEAIIATLCALRVCLCIECSGKSEKRRTAGKVIDLRTSSAAGQPSNLSTPPSRWGRDGGYSAHRHGIVRYLVHWDEETTGCTSHRTGEASHSPCLLALNGSVARAPNVTVMASHIPARPSLNRMRPLPPLSGYCRLRIFTYIWEAR